MRVGMFGLIVSTLLAVTPAAKAAPNLLVNGDFETFSSPVAAQVQSPNDPTGSLLGSTTGGVYSGWVNAGYTFLFTPGSADTTGSLSTEYGNTLNLWGPGVGGGGVKNGLTATSPTGGNYIGSDGAYQQGAISQTVNGLGVGQAYKLTFWWAAGQQQSFTGATTEAWGVTFGGQTFNTAVVNNPSQGFTPWMQQTFTFVATSATQTLSFLAMGTPTGTPPFSLLDGVVLVAAPEPATWAVLLMALGGLAWMRRGPRAPMLPDAIGA